MSDNNNNNSANQDGSSKKRKADGTGPSPRGKKLTNDLLATLDNPDLCDVTLVGSDGGRVPAIRVYLSARSEVLQHLLVGQFREASEDEVRMDYPAAVLKALVHFCCTDEIPDINTLGDDAVTSMRMAVKLVEAADYYGLTLLKQKTTTALIAWMNDSLEEEMQGLIICAAFEEVSRKPSLEALTQVLYNGIKARVPQALVLGERPGVTLLSSTSLRTIVEDPELKACASALFKAIKVWLDNEVPLEAEALESQEERKDFVKQLASNLELRMISPKDLLGPVSDSGLIEHSKIIQALQSQSVCGMVGIYGCLVDGLDVNGIYEEIPINAKFEPVPADDPTRTSHARRFDKRRDPSSDERNLSVLAFCRSRRESGGAFGPGVTKEQIFTLLAPPVGAASLVLTGNRQEILHNFVKSCKENMSLYAGGRAAQPSAKPDGTDIKWGLPGHFEVDPRVEKTKRFPKMIIGPRLSTEQCIPPDTF